jgi:atypical dual specificity phosphatase
MKLPKLIILVGLPGSGKSYFSKHLQSTNSNKIIIVSQDDLGTKAACENLLIKSIKGNKTVIVDKCNPTIKDRQYWVTYAMLNKKDVLVIFFDFPKEECIKQVKNRIGHPTIKFGRGEKIVDTFHKQLEKPMDDEGFKKVVTISTFTKCNEILKKFGCDPKTLSDESHNIIKFPRTHHIFDAGVELGLNTTGVTRDDLLLSDQEINKYLHSNLTLEEKVDGANLGISIDDEYNILFQNRSHYVTYSSATQFKGLKAWQETHCGDVFIILQPNRHILYGEWCYAKHSIHYTELPNYFVAFDIFDKFENKFYSRERFHQAMSKTNIPCVPVLEKVVYESKEQLKRCLLAHLDDKSMFTDSHVEGVYIRKDDDSNVFLERRCKLVRADFIQHMNDANVHWSKVELVKNTVKY